MTFLDPKTVVNTRELCQRSLLILPALVAGDNRPDSKHKL